ncbi:hypothetical protein GpartN1_g395.t1 [Galdieria partita]|uniref:Phosphoglycolate phosphatase n=1 Tax=Galdieria partita TaxID=83374 RepID=A0A9C7UMG1_9RHOD|nr:hypothetical protein GpartN1_g395.t1 [Galdieria partita]
MAHLNNTGVAYALDFDGVLCDSCLELICSALLSIRSKWPEVLQGLVPNPLEPPDWLVSKLQKLRPLVEIGYEMILLVLLVVEEQHASIRSQQKSRPLSVGEIMENWHSQIKDQLWREYKTCEKELIDLFGKTRDEWIQHDLQGWLGKHRFYPGIVDALNFSESPLFVVTTKEKRFVCQLFKHSGVEMKEERIYGLDAGNKVKVLKSLIKLDELKKRTLYFVEDRVETLEDACLTMLGTPVKFYLASWGYNTEEMRARAARNPQIEVIDLQTFVMKMQ